MKILLLLVFLCSLYTFKAEKTFSFRLNRYNPHSSEPDRLTCEDFGIFDECQLEFRICLGYVSKSNLNLSLSERIACDLVKANIDVATELTSFTIGHIFGAYNEPIYIVPADRNNNPEGIVLDGLCDMGGSERVDNHVQDKLGLLVEVYNILDKDSLLFNYTANFVPESSAEGLLKTDKNFLKLEYQYYQNCDKNLFGPGCSKYCALTHTYRCDISGNKICTLKCGATDTCTWDKGEDQFHCACDKEKGCTETKSYHKVCPKNFCRYGHKVCYREAKVCICEMPKMKRSSCYFLNDLILPAHIAPDPVKNTSESLHSTPKRQPASKGPISHPNATNNQSGNSLSGVIIFLLVFLSISILVLVVVVSWKICKERQMRQEFDYGRMGGNSRQRIALDDMEDDFHPPMEEPSVQYVASQPVHNGRYDAEPIIPE